MRNWFVSPGWSTSWIAAANRADMISNGVKTDCNEQKMNKLWPDTNQVPRILPKLANLTGHVWIVKHQQHEDCCDREHLWGSCPQGWAGSSPEFSKVFWIAWSDLFPEREEHELEPFIRELSATASHLSAKFLTTYLEDGKCNCCKRLATGQFSHFEDIHAPIIGLLVQDLEYIGKR